MAVLVSDSFNRADSTTTLGTTDSLNGGTAKTWAYLGTAVWGISSNQAYTATTANDSPAVIDMTTQADNARVSVDVIVSTGLSPNGLSFRVQDPANYFRAYGDNGAVRIDRVLAGASTTIGNQSLTGITAPFTISVELTGSTIKAFVNGVLKITVTDSNLLTATKHGLYIGNGASPRLDNFKIEDLAAPPTNFSGSGTASGIATVSATNTLRKQSIGTSSGKSQDSATPVYRRSAVGTSSGIATTSASIGIITQHASGTSSGITTASATPIQRRQSIGTSSGIATNTAIPNFRRSVSVIANGSSWTYISAPSSGTSDVYYYRKKMISRFGLLK